MDYENIMAWRGKDMEGRKVYALHSAQLIRDVIGNLAIVFLQYKQIRFMCSQKWNCAASFPFPYSCICERFIHIFPWSVHQGIGNDAVQFHSWEYLFRIFGTVSSQCVFPKFLPHQSTIFLYMVIWFSAFSLQFFSRSYFSQLLCWIYFFKLCAI